jgi:putative drug exporter of the RND superfamily
MTSWSLSRRVAGPGTRPGRPGLYRLGSWAARHPAKVISVWLMLLGFATVSASYFTSHLTSNSNQVTGSGSQQAAALIAEKFPAAAGETDFVVLHSRGLTAGSAPFRRAVSAAAARYRRAPRVTSVTSPYAAPRELISPDGHTALIPVGFSGSTGQLQQEATPLQDTAAALSTSQVRVYVTGSAPLAAADASQEAADLGRAESIGLPVAAVVLVIAFGSLVAAAVPLVLGVLAVLSAFGALGVVSLFTPLDAFVQTATSMVGIALGIDYSLLIITRFREELAAAQDGAWPDRAAAAGRAMATAGKAVVFTGGLVVMALACLWLVRAPGIHAMALGMIAAVAVMVILALTLLPAVLGLLGERINRFPLPWARRSLAHPDPEHSAWARLAAVVIRRPVAFAVVPALALGALALPVFGLRYGLDLGASDVAGSRAGQGYTLISGSFTPGLTSPIDVTVSGDPGRVTGARATAVTRFAAAAAASSDVTRVTTALSRDGTTSLVTVWPRYPADSTQTASLVRELRGTTGHGLADAGLTVHVGGVPAQVADIEQESSRATPLVIATVLATSLVLLLFVFRSVLLPVKAVLMNLLTSGSAFGLAVLVFQDGHGAALLGVSRTGFIQAIVPLFAFALVFGLSMDYEVFLLSRIREEWDLSRGNRRAIQYGVAHTGRVITAAAAIMVVVFASFTLARNTEIKQIGFMLAAAVLIDATVVRLLLVPALMRIMGAANWWLPRWPGRARPDRPALSRRAPDARPS